MTKTIDPLRPKRTIVVGYQETPSGCDALREAQRLAALSGARIIAVAVYEAPLGVAGGLKDCELWLRHDAERSVEALEGVEPRVIASHSPADALLQVIRDEQADLVIVGSSGRARKGEVRSGPVGARLTAEAPCGVIIVSAGQLQPPIRLPLAA